MYSRRRLREIRQILGSQVLLSKTIQLNCRTHSANYQLRDIVFILCSSGSTGHAVLNQNTEDDNDRRFILVEIITKSQHITAERLKRVIEGYTYKDSG
jgi:hypothetical protein